MASRRSRKRARRARRGWSGSTLVTVIVAAAALAGALYLYGAPKGWFEAGKPAVVTAGTPAAEEAKPAETAGAPKAAPAPAPKPAPAPAPQPAPAPAPAPEPAAPVCEAPVLSVSDAQFMVSNPSLKFVDVRPEASFKAGHIPGALSVPANDFAAAFPKAEPVLNQSGGVILYGEDAFDGAIAEVCVKMKGRVQPRVYSFREGWQRWLSVGGAKQ